MDEFVPLLLDSVAVCPASSASLRARRNNAPAPAAARKHRSSVTRKASSSMWSRRERWVIRYSVELTECCRQYEKPVGRSWRCDETYIKVGGRWMYLYRAVDQHGKTVESHLSRTRDISAAKAFFRKALKRHGEPRTITLDGFEPSHSALRRMGMRNEFNFCWENPVKIRSCQYLNNIVEQDHRRIKSRIQPMLGFKTFYNARRVLMGIELMQKIHKGQIAFTPV